MKVVPQRGDKPKGNREMSYKGGEAWSKVERNRRKKVCICYISIHSYIYTYIHTFIHSLIHIRLLFIIDSSCIYNNDRKFVCMICVYFYVFCEVKIVPQRDKPKGNREMVYKGG